MWEAQRRKLPGQFFNREEDVQMPHRFVYVEHRMRFGAGEGQEVDVLGAAGAEIWVCQSKWWVEQPVGVGVLRTLEAKEDLVWEKMREVGKVRLWLFANAGLTVEAKAYAAEHGILWSARAEFDELLAYLGLRALPRL